MASRSFTCHVRTDVRSWRRRDVAPLFVAVVFAVLMIRGPFTSWQGPRSFPSSSPELLSGTSPTTSRLKIESLWKLSSSDTLAALQAQTGLRRSSAFLSPRRGVLRSADPCVGGNVLKSALSSPGASGLLSRCVCLCVCACVCVCIREHVHMRVCVCVCEACVQWGACEPWLSFWLLCSCRTAHKPFSVPVLSLRCPS